MELSEVMDIACGKVCKAGCVIMNKFFNSVCICLYRPQMHENGFVFYIYLFVYFLAALGLLLRQAF